MKELKKMLEVVKTWMAGLWLYERLASACARSRERVQRCWVKIWCYGMEYEPGIDGILVTVGLCIIALLLCVVMKNSLSDFIKSIVSSMTKEASDILSGNRV